MLTEIFVTLRVKREKMHNIEIFNTEKSSDNIFFSMIHMFLGWFYTKLCIILGGWCTPPRSPPLTYVSLTVSMSFIVNFMKSLSVFFNINICIHEKMYIYINDSYFVKVFYLIYYNSMHTIYQIFECTKGIVDHLTLLTLSNTVITITKYLR